MMKELTLKTSDNFPLFVKVFEPKISNGKVLLINSATGVKQQVYFSFARYFAENGFTVITYDYRGIGESKPKKLAGFEANMRIWGTVDFKTLTHYIRQEYPEELKYCLGHSVGALIVGMNQDSAIFSKFIFVATQDAQLSNLSFKVALTGFLGFGIALPILSEIFGYFPAHRFGLGESLPKGVAYDWKTLIINKKSTKRLYEKIGANNAENFDQETLIIYAEDDPWVTMKGMENLMKNVYPNLRKTYRKVWVKESPKLEIGHVNFFRTYNRPLWKIILEKI